MKMKHVALLFMAAALAGSAWAADESQSFQLKNRLRLQYDDNVNETDTDEQDSFNVIEEVEFLVNLNLQQSFLGFRYRPTFMYWSDREPDDTDFNHDVDVIVSHSFTPRVSVSVKDTLRKAQQPELIDRGNVIREQDDFLYNVADGVLSILLAPDTRIEAAGRYTTLRYDEDDVADNEDYDISSVGLNLRHEMTQDLAIQGEARLETTDYTDSDRGAESTYGGLALENVFSPNLLGNVRGGVQYKQFDEDNLDSETAPYGEASVTFLPSPATRITAGAGYSMFESDVYPFASQDRTTFFVSAAHDLTARVALYLAGSYQLSDYSGDQAIDGTVATDEGAQAPSDGEESVYQLSGRASYKLNHSNWLEFSWQYLSLDSDFRTEFDRNRAEIGWRTQL